MSVRMTVCLACRIVGCVRVLMVGVVDMAVLVVERLVQMIVVVALRQM